MAIIFPRQRCLAAILMITISVSFAVLQGRAAVLFTNLYSFTGATDGGNPSGKLVQAPDKSFYGTAGYGGGFGKGVIFKMSPDGMVSNLFTFDGTDGATPLAGLILANDDNLYGTTSGSTTGLGGTVFRINPTGLFTNLAEFYSWQGSPIAPLLQEPNGDFLGTTPDAGLTGERNGSVFEIDSNGSLIMLRFFCETINGGRWPHSALILGGDGNYYGTAMYGKTNGAPSSQGPEQGIVYRISPQGDASVFAGFSGTNGAFPVASLTLGSDGNYYGTTSGGGEAGWGTVFQLTTNGIINTLHVFSGNSDGGNPQSDLVQGNDGNLYGTTLQGGINDSGVIYQVSSDGSFTALYKFTGGVDGKSPFAGLLRGYDGGFYGTTMYGGKFGSGVIFRISVVPSSPARLYISKQQTGQISLTWNAEAGIAYQPQSSAEIGSINWTNFTGPVTTNSDGIVSVLTAVVGADRFYRVVTLVP